MRGAMHECNCVGDNELGLIYVADRNLLENMSVFPPKCYATQRTNPFFLQRHKAMTSSSEPGITGPLSTGSSGFVW